MRQTLLRWYFMITTVLLITMLGCVVQSGNGFVWTVLGISHGLASERIQGLLDSTEPVADNPDLAIRANLIPSSSNNGFINPRQDPPPVWERILETKLAGFMLGFFFAIMVISLFFIFYRSSRNSSGNDDDSLQICLIYL